MSKRCIAIAMAAATLTTSAIAREPIVLACAFKTQPPMILIYRGGMGADDNTLQVGQRRPVQLFQGSGFSTATVDDVEYTFSIGARSSVIIGKMTFGGRCASTLRP